MRQRTIIVADPDDLSRALERFNEKVTQGWKDGYLIATDSFRVVLTNRAAIIAAIMEREESA